MQENTCTRHDVSEKFDHMPQLAEFEAIAQVFKILEDATRVRLFWLLCHCESCVLNLGAMMEMSSPAISHHLKVLKASGLVTARREGKEVIYKAAETEQVRALHEIIETVVRIACPAQTEENRP